LRKGVIQDWLATSEPKRLHVGAGSVNLPGWLDTDLEPLRGGRQTIFLDITETLPFPAASIDCILSEHVIEHVSFHQGRDFLRECFRVLKPGGVLRVSTPDLAILFALHGRALSEIERRYVEDVIDRFFPNCPRYDAIFAINTEFREFGHQFLYDEPTLTESLRSAGFKSIARYPMGESPAASIAGVESHGRAAGRYEVSVFETMSLEAIRP
jgi:SAM-dependent methyltransferase